MDWEAAGAATTPRRWRGACGRACARLVDARWSTPALHAHGRSEPLWTGNDHVFGLVREHAGDRLLVLANLSEEGQRVDAGVLHEHGIRDEGEGVEPGPYAWAWLTG